MFRSLLLVSAFCLFGFSSAYAAATPAQPNQAAPANQPVTIIQGDTNVQPDLVSFGLAYMNFDKTEARRQTPDFRLEYRWGMSLLPMVSGYFRKWDPYVQIHPFAGGEATSFGQLYGLGGFAADIYATKHLIFTWSEGAGLYYPGDAVRLGSFVEFRSEIEAGWRFDNNVRLTFEASHISNAKITRFNPGAEIAGFYLHMPIDNILGKTQP